MSMDGDDVGEVRGIHRGYRGLMGRSVGRKGQYRRSPFGRRALQGALALVIAVVPFVVNIPAAFAGIGFGVIPTFPSPVTVGQTGLPASLTIANDSTTPDNASPVTLDTITLVPACGSS